MVTLNTHLKSEFQSAQTQSVSITCINGAIIYKIFGNVTARKRFCYFYHVQLCYLQKNH
jgi:hypothetical protein